MTTIVNYEELEKKKARCSLVHSNFQFDYLAENTSHVIFMKWIQLVILIFVFPCIIIYDTAWSRSTHTCTYLYQLHVHYMSLLRMDVYYIWNM